jgi:SAM-dependent methyltransferase
LVIAVEPSAAMIQQRPPGGAVVVQAAAEDLPFEDKFFDASMAILTVHHWSDVPKGLREMRRVTGQNHHSHLRSTSLQFLAVGLPAGTWNVGPTGVADFEAILGPVQRIAVPIPHDCTDGILCAYWRRPAAYFEPKVRRSMSSFWKIGDVTEALGDASREDLEFVNREPSSPGDVQALVRQVPKGLENQIYAVSVIGIDLDSQKEAEYLAALGPGHRAP